MDVVAQDNGASSASWILGGWGEGGTLMDCDSCQCFCGDTLFCSLCSLHETGDCPCPCHWESAEYDEEPEGT